MNTYVADLQKVYRDWITKEVKFTSKENFVVIDTPFVDSLNDNIQLVIEKFNDYYIVSDDGYTLDELEMVNPDIIKKGRRKDWFMQTLRNFGVSLNDYTRELYVRFENLNDFPLVQTRLIQCTLQVSDLFYTTRDRVVELFSEDVANFFVEQDLPITQNIIFRGKSGSDVNFDISIGKTKYRKQSAIKVVNNPSGNSYQLPLFSINDTRDLRTDTDFYIIANNENKVANKFITACKNYEVPLLMWSEREKWINQFKIV